ncbi:acyloxyacyl hydrolase [Aurantiacibacter poecillastricola]|uniref:acyloxyacyl hydrolase n=1 Tax=Aurantiacibacter poecillastricola TaxID=3064385 RepID=UPI00273DBF08|nr:acyloxyacyl hydrolase [Aurantiacibacter sp. 219JJ12-13]MDP5260197.1 acyloxyacyl hydrolase [Aurantiacibacter sp. 219JJ12-13]
MLKPIATLAAATALAAIATPAAAQEVFGGVYAHGVDTPFTLETTEGGTVDIAAGIRFGGIEALDFIGSPEPYIVGNLNTEGYTSFAGAGLSWTIGKGPFFVRPGIGLVVHDGPEFRVNPATGIRTDLGSRVLFEPEIGVGYRLSERSSIEAHWMHISQGQIFDGEQNPGIDMIGARVNWKL